MNAPLFATMVVRAAEGLTMHGPFAKRTVATNWYTTVVPRSFVGCCALTGSACRR